MEEPESLPENLSGSHHPVMSVLFDGKLEALVHGINIGGIELLQSGTGLVRRLERDVRIGLLHGVRADFPKRKRKKL